MTAPEPALFPKTKTEITTRTMGSPATSPKPLTIMAWDTATPWCVVVLERFNPDGSSINLGSFTSSGEGRATQILAWEVDRLLREAEVKPAQLDLLAVGRGPGSFTGLRIGLALAKGLAYGAGVELIGLNTLEVVAASLARHYFNQNKFAQNQDQMVPGTLVAPLIDAHHGQIFTALYRVTATGTLSLLLEPQPLEPTTLPEHLLKITSGENILVGGPAWPILDEACPLLLGAGGKTSQLIVVTETTTSATAPAAAPASTTASTTAPTTAPNPTALARLAWQLRQSGGDYLGANPPNPLYIRQPQIW